MKAFTSSCSAAGKTVRMYLSVLHINPLGSPSFDSYLLLLRLGIYFGNGYWLYGYCYTYYHEPDSSVHIYILRFRLFLHKNNCSQVCVSNILGRELGQAHKDNSTVVLSTGFASVSATGPAMIPTTALSTAKPTSATQTGAATNVRMGSCAAVLIGVAGFFMTM